MNYTHVQTMKLMLNALAKSADTFDLSFCLTDEGIEERLLVGWWTKNAPSIGIREFALQWGMSSAMVDRWLADAGDSDGVGITVNRSMSSARIYTHHWNRTSPSQRGAVIYRGYKTLPDGTVRIDDYQYCGDLRDKENLEFAKENSSHPDWLDRIIKVAPADRPLVFSRITGPGRLSWLATVRHANLDSSDFLGAQPQRRKLLHLAGGIDATKGRFDTVYVSASLKSASNFLSL